MTTEAVMMAMSSGDIGAFSGAGAGTSALAGYAQSGIARQPASGDTGGFAGGHGAVLLVSEPGSCRIFAEVGIPSIAWSGRCLPVLPVVPRGAGEKTAIVSGFSGADPDSEGG